MIHKYIKVFIILLFISAIADICTTMYIISHGGVELNPFMVSIVKDPLLCIISKFGIVIGSSLTILAVYKYIILPKVSDMWRDIYLYASFLFPNLITLIVVFNNIYAIYYYVN